MEDYAYLDSCTLTGNTSVANDFSMYTNNISIDSNYYQIGPWYLSREELEHKLNLLDRLLREHYPEEFI